MPKRLFYTGVESILFFRSGGVAIVSMSPSSFITTTEFLFAIAFASICGSLLLDFEIIDGASPSSGIVSDSTIGMSSGNFFVRNDAFVIIDFLNVFASTWRGSWLERNGKGSKESTPRTIFSRLGVSGFPRLCLRILGWTGRIKEFK